MPTSHRPSKLTIGMLAAANASDEHLAREITELVNSVYATAEAGLWIDGASRTTAVEMQTMIASDEIALATLDDEVVGSIRIQELDDRIGEFGMLVAHPAHRGEGVGRQLVGFAEERSRRRGSTVMQLELLRPRGWSHPTKDFLEVWYTRLGYRPVRAGSIDESYPHLAPLLTGPCDFVVFHKLLDTRTAAAEEVVH